MKRPLLMLFIAMFVSPVFAQQRDVDDQGTVEKEKKVDQLAIELGLTEEQKIKIQASREKYKTQIMDKQTAFNSAKEKFGTAIQDPNASTEDLEQAFKQKGEAQRLLQETLFQSRMEFRDVLTPDQRVKMISKRESRHGKKIEKKQNLKEKKDEWSGRKGRKQPDTNSPDAVPAPTPVK